MKTSSQIDQLSPHGIEFMLGPYPPLGFVPVSAADLGNGDFFGLYWPLGRENEEPVVCDMLHDEWSLELAFSSVDKFLEYLQLNDWQRGDEEVDDEEFAPAYFMHARQCLTQNNVDEAIRSLEKAATLFPEAGDYWLLLSSQYRRTGEHQKAIEAAVNAFASNWVFGASPQNALRMLQSKQAQSLLPDDPLVKRASDLTQSFGGEKENSNYTILSEVIAEYFDQGENVKALLLHQNYAYMMNLETVSFQERNQFDLGQWQAEFSQLCQEKLGDDRRFEG